MVVRPQHADDGFTIMEVVVATMIFALAATVLAGVFIKTLSLAKSNTQRTTAANLATAQMEKLRAVRALDIPDSSVITTAVGGTVYTIKQLATLGTPNGTACNGTGAISSKRVTVLVTWPDMGNVKPVRSDTIRTLGTGTDDVSALQGTVAVAVQSAAGTGSSGVQVTLKTAPGGSVVDTEVAGADGCAVFANLPVGNYTASANTSGYVNLDGAQATVSSGVGVTAATVSKVVLPYDLLGGMSVTPSAAGGYTIPSSLGLTLTTSVWSPSQKRVYVTCPSPSVVTGCVSGTSVRTATSLFPASYGAWAGTCADAAPPSSTLVSVTSGNTAAYTVTNLRPVNALIGSVATGNHLYAVHAADASCASGEVYDLGVVSPLSTVKVALPLGIWRMQLTSTGNVPTQAVTLSNAVTAAQSVTVLL